NTRSLDADIPSGPRRVSRIAAGEDGVYSITLDLGDRVPPVWMATVLSRIVEFLGLEPGWNSHAAAPLTLRAAEVGLEVLATAVEQGTPPPAVVLLSTGGLQIEWH